jgi:hypothetical protein
VENADSRQSPDSPIAQPRQQWRARLIGYVKRYLHERKSKKETESPADRAARRTATATVWIAVFTVVLAIVGGVTLYEVVTGGNDTHTLAVAAIAANRAWLAPDIMNLMSALEAGLPVKYSIHIINTGKEPALGMVWNVKPIGVPYIDPTNPNTIEMERNVTCDGLEPRPYDGMVLYPVGGTNFWVPLYVPDTTDNQQLIREVLNKTKSLVIDGCFAYRTGGGKHTSAFRFFLRDVSGKSFVADKNGNMVPAWKFNVTLTGNEAN